jgi:hypothetical protein
MNFIITLQQQQQQMEYIEDGAGQTYHLLTSTSTTGSTMALITKYNKNCTSTDAATSQVIDSKSGRKIIVIKIKKYKKKNKKCRTRNVAQKIILNFYVRFFFSYK